MYLVFIALLALNVSADVLNGFRVMNNQMQTSSSLTEKRNEQVMRQLEHYHQQNSAKAHDWVKRAKALSSESDSLVSYIEQLKQDIAILTDGKKGDPNHLKKEDKMHASSEVMLSPVSRKGRSLRHALEHYRQTATEWVMDDLQRKLIETNLSTTPPPDKSLLSWEEAIFEDLSSIGAITYLSKLQLDIRQVEGDVLTQLLRSIDASDVRVNQLEAHIIPESNTVMQGGTYKARVVLSASDSTQQNHVVINGSSLSAAQNGRVELSANRVGVFPIKGYVEALTGDGQLITRPFETTYTVVEPMATIAPTLMNVLYAGIENEISISVPGFETDAVSATMTNGTLTKQGNKFIAKPSRVDEDAVIRVSVKSAQSNHVQHVASSSFRVRALPNPTPFIHVGAVMPFTGGNISKKALMEAKGVQAAIDDGILNIRFKVISFKTVYIDSMGNAIPEVSDGSSFSARQIEQIRRMTRGSSFYISSIKASGPDGTTRDVSPMEVRIN